LTCLEPRKNDHNRDDNRLVRTSLSDDLLDDLLTALTTACVCMLAVRVPVASGGRWPGLCCSSRIVIHATRE